MTFVIDALEWFAEEGIEPSLVGSKGDSQDSALAERIKGLYKAELIHRLAPRKTRESVHLSTKHREWLSMRISPVSVKRW